MGGRIWGLNTGSFLQIRATWHLCWNRTNLQSNLFMSNVYTRSALVSDGFFSVIFFCFCISLSRRSRKRKVSSSPLADFLRESLDLYSQETILIIVYLFKHKSITYTTICKNWSRGMKEVMSCQIQNQLLKFKYKFITCHMQHKTIEICKNEWVMVHKRWIRGT